MRINCNMSAILANNYLQTTQSKLQASIERLSSGYKINRAADNAAGLAIANKMNTQIRGLNRANQNASDGISVVETAEGALAEINSMLQRMRELAVQASNGSYTADDREALQQEVDELSTEIDRIAKDTEFNKKCLLDGSLSQRAYTDSIYSSVMDFSTTVNTGTYEITVTAVAVKEKVTGDNLVSLGTAVSGSETGTISINGQKCAINEGDTLEDIYEKLVEVGNLVQVEVTSNNGDSISVGESFVFTSGNYGSSKNVEITCDNALLAQKLGIDTTTKVEGEDAKVALVTSTTEGFRATAVVSCDGNRVTVTDNSQFKMVVDIEEGLQAAITAGGGSTTLNIDVTDIGTMSLQVGANEGQVIEIRIPEISTKALGINNINLLNPDDSGEAISYIDKALEKITSIRGEIGACQNRLEHAIENLQVMEENVTNAYSRIMDTDMAEEMTNYTQLNVLSQAGMAMLTQANELPQQVLQLLQ